MIILTSAIIIMPILYMIVAFKDQDNRLLREVVPVQIINQCAMLGKCDTKFVASKHSTI